MELNLKGYVVLFNYLAVDRIIFISNASNDDLKEIDNFNTFKEFFFFSL